MAVRELLIGCGNRRVKEISIQEVVEWHELVTLDVDPTANPDVVHDLNILPYPFEDNSFDEIHAYEVMEHTGQQGDWRWFFAQWSEFYRILKPDGQFYGTSPLWNTNWAWGDPGHSRVIQPESLIFLDQDQYAKQVGNTPMTDYRHVWQGDFEPLSIGPMQPAQGQKPVRFYYVLKAVKPSRIGVQ